MTVFKLTRRDKCSMCGTGREYIKKLETMRGEVQFILGSFVHLKPTEQSMLGRLKIALAALESVEK